MGGMRPRKTVPDTPQSSDRKLFHNDDARENINGLGNKGGPLRQDQMSSENIFLFYPNIIGMTPKR